MTAAAPGAAEPAIALRDLSVAFARPVLRHIDLEIPKGCLYGLIGPGASGKSVLLKCLAGLLRPQHGQVRVLGKEVTWQVHAQAVCAAYRLTQGDQAAFAVFGASLQNAKLTARAKALLADPSGCN